MRRRSQIGRMRAAEDLERRELNRRGAERDSSGHRAHRSSCLAHRAGQRGVERLADRDRAGAGSPPAADRIDRLRRGRLCAAAVRQGTKHEQREQGTRASLDAVRASRSRALADERRHGIATWSMTSRITASARQAVARGVRPEPDAVAEHERRQLLHVFRIHLGAAAAAAAPTPWPAGSSR